MSQLVTMHTGIPAELPAVTLYRILQLRTDVFVVEQNCPYPELDGRDLEPGARWMWAQSGDQILATLRVLRDGRTARIGRVATAVSSRSSGIGGRLMNYTLELIDAEIDTEIDTDNEAGNDIVLSAQSRLAGWYQKFGFIKDGNEFVEDGIAHTPMRRAAGNS